MTALSPNSLTLMNQLMAQLIASINALNTPLALLETTLEGVSGGKDYTTNIAAVQAAVAALTTPIGNVQAAVSALSTPIGNVQTAVSALNTPLASILAAFAGLQPKTAGRATLSVSPVITTSSVKVLSANPNRIGLICYNNSANSVYLAYGVAANSSNSMTRILATFANFTMESPIYTGDIYAIRNAGTGTLLFTELTAS